MREATATQQEQQNQDLAMKGKTATKALGR